MTFSCLSAATSSTTSTLKEKKYFTNNELFTKLLHTVNSCVSSFGHLTCGAAGGHTKRSVRTQQCAELTLA